MFWPGRVASTMRIVVGFGGLAPFVPATTLHSGLMSYQVSSEPLVSMPPCGP
jgi:hypothetical protein